MSFFNHSTIVMSVSALPTQARGRSAVRNGVIFQKQSWPEDAIGLFNLTLQNLVVGSAIQVQASNGVALFSGSAATDTKLIPLSAFAPGSPYNLLKVKVRKGSESPYYQPWETQAVSVVGSQALFVSQIPDE